MTHSKKPLVVFLFITILLLLFVNGTSAYGSNNESPGTFEPAECWFEDPIPYLPTPDFTCGYVIVPETHANPDTPPTAESTKPFPEKR